MCVATERARATKQHSPNGNLVSGALPRKTKKGCYVFFRTMPCEANMTRELVLFPFSWLTEHSKFQLIIGVERKISESFCVHTFDPGMQLYTDVFQVNLCKIQSCADESQSSCTRDAIEISKFTNAEHPWSNDDDVKPNTLPP